MRLARGFALVGPVLLAGVSQAQSHHSATLWSVSSGQTVGADNNVFWGEGGYPGLSASLLHGLNDNFDIGGRFTFNYGYEGSTSTTTPGLKLQLLMRAMVVDSGKVRVALTFEPGPLVYFFSSNFFTGSYTQFGIAFPIGLQVGIPVNNNLLVNFGLDLPMFVVFGTGSGFVIPIMFGGGVEYFIDPTFAITFKMRVGPLINTNGGGAVFGLNALVGVALKF